MAPINVRSIKVDAGIMPNDPANEPKATVVASIAFGTQYPLLGNEPVYISPGTYLHRADVVRIVEDFIEGFVATHGTAKRVDLNQLRDDLSRRGC